MTTPTTIECTIHIRRGPKGSRQLRTEAPPTPLPAGRVPRIARLLALARKFDALVGHGTVLDCASLARVGHVSRARISQIMNLLQLAPDIQEQILFLPQTVRGPDPIHLHQLQPIARVLEWQRQRQLWRDLLHDTTSMLESKEAMKSRGIKSPDYGDALALAYHVGTPLREFQIW